MSYTVSPVHNLNYWVEMGKNLEDVGCHSICIKDMAGLIKPYVAFELVSRLKEAVEIPLTLHSHATTGMSTAAHLKAAEAGIDMIDTTISSMSMTYGHSPTESLVAIMDGTDRDTGLNLSLLEEIAAYFRVVRKKYAKFEGALRGIDSRILVAQVPGGMLTNMENQLREQNASDKLDAVLEEIPRVREDLGFIPLVTPTSQIVGTQSVINVLMGERYKTITKETAGVLKGEYGKTQAPVNKELQARVLEGAEPITVRPADLLEPEVDKLTKSFRELAKERGIRVAEEEIDDVLTYALFPQVGLKFLENRDNPDAFEPAPGNEPEPAKTAVTAPMPATREPEAYSVSVNGKAYEVVVGPSGSVATVSSATPTTAAAPAAAPVVGPAQDVPAPLAGNIYKMLASPGQTVKAGDVIVVLEAMKMETEVRSPADGTVTEVIAKEGDAVQIGDILLKLG
jgi:oxaloacetate decarboxylase alpha subunit